MKRLWPIYAICSLALVGWTMTIYAWHQSTNDWSGLVDTVNARWKLTFDSSGAMWERTTAKISNSWKEECERESKDWQKLFKKYRRLP